MLYTHKPQASTTIGQRLLLARRELRMTQQQVASRAGNVSAAYISDLERGKVSDPAVSILVSLARAVGLSASYLAGWDDDPLGESRGDSIAESRVVYQASSEGEYREVQSLLDVLTDLPSAKRSLLLTLAEELSGVADVRVIG